MKDGEHIPNPYCCRLCHDRWLAMVGRDACYGPKGQAPKGKPYWTWYENPSRYGDTKGCWHENAFERDRTHGDVRYFHPTATFGVTVQAIPTDPWVRWSGRIADAWDAVSTAVFFWKLRLLYGPPPVPKPTEFCPQCAESMRLYGSLGPVGGGDGNACCSHGVCIDFRDYLDIEWERRPRPRPGQHFPNHSCCKACSEAWMAIHGHTGVQG